MSHHDRLEQVLGRLRKMDLNDDEVEAAVSAVNNVTQGYGPVESIRVARVDDPAQVATFVLESNRDFGHDCSPQETVVRVKRHKLLLVGYHYDHSK